MKILVVGTTDNQGGAARVGWDIGRELINRGHEVKYIVGYKKSDRKFVYELSKPYITKWLDDHTRYNATSLFRHVRSYIFSNTIDFGASNEILEHPWYKEADIVHIHNLHGNFFKLSILKKIDQDKKIIWTLHDMWAVTGKCAYTDDQKKWQDGYHKCRTLGAYPPTLWDNSKYMWEKKNSLYKDLTHTTIVVPSNWLDKIVSKSILKHLPRVVIHNGVDQFVYQFRSKYKLRNKLGLPLKKKIIVFVAHGGQSDPRKGWKYIQNIMNCYRTDSNLHFLAIGDGKEITNLPNITTIPFISNKSALAEYYSASDVLLFTSLAENCPLVLLEALSSGLPVISFNVGGVPELIIHKKNGYVARYKDDKDLARGLSWILGLKDEERHNMGLDNIARAKKFFSTKVMVDKYEKLYNQL